jgi:hypothetical protein
MEYNRDNKGRFARSKKAIIWFLVIVGIGAYFIIIAKPRTFEVYNEYQAQAADTLNAKLADLKTDMMDQLSLGCETKGVKEPDGAILLDANGKMSIGRYMFQIDTVIYFVKKYEGRTISRREAIELAVNPDRARALAEKILFTEVDGWQHWANCSNKLGLQKEIEIIKKLQ